MAKETVYNNTLVSGAADETLTYTRYVKDESSGKSTKELLDEKVNKTDQLGTTQIADKAVTTEKLENESVTTDKLDAASVTTDKVADANITTSKLADSSVDTEKINNKAVTTDKLNDGAVDNSKLSPNAVTSEKIKNESIITEKLNDQAVTTEKVDEKAITNTKIGDSAVDGRTISEASVEKKHLANDSVATEKLQDSSVTSDKIHTDAVTEEKIKDSSVSNSKLADNSVGTSKIKDGNITNEKVANNTLTLDKLDQELRKSIQAATGLPENLVEVIQDVDKEVKTLHSKDTDLQSQIKDKQQQISAHDMDIELLQTRSTQMEQTINNIAATGGASVANTVAYTNTTSGLESVNAQGAIDELAAKNKSQDAKISAMAEKSDVQAAVSDLKEKDSALSAEIAKKANDSDVTSKFTEESKRVNGELAKKANAEDVSSQMQTEQERVNTEFAKKFDKESILQGLGDAEDKVISQKAVSAKLSDLSEYLVEGDAYNIGTRDTIDKLTNIDNQYGIIVFGNKGDEYELKGLGGIYYRLWATISYDGTIIRRSEPDIDATKNKVIITLEDKEVGFVFNSSSKDSSVKFLKSISNSINKLNNQVNEFKSNITELNKGLNRKVNIFTVAAFDASEQWNNKANYKAISIEDGINSINIVLQKAKDGDVLILSDGNFKAANNNNSGIEISKNITILGQGKSTYIERTNNAPEITVDYDNVSLVVKNINVHHAINIAAKNEYARYDSSICLQNIYKDGVPLNTDELNYILNANLPTVGLNGSDYMHYATIKLGSSNAMNYINALTYRTDKLPASENIKDRTLLVLPGIYKGTGGIEFNKTYPTKICGLKGHEKDTVFSRTDGNIILKQTIYCSPSTINNSERIIENISFTELVSFVNCPNFKMFNCYRNGNKLDDFCMSNYKFDVGTNKIFSNVNHALFVANPYAKAGNIVTVRIYGESRENSLVDVNVGNINIEGYCEAKIMRLGQNQDPNASDVYGAGYCLKLGEKFNGTLMNVDIVLAGCQKGIDLPALSVQSKKARLINVKAHNLSFPAIAAKNEADDILVRVDNNHNIVRCVEDSSSSTGYLAHVYSKVFGTETSTYECSASDVSALHNIHLTVRKPDESMSSSWEDTDGGRRHGIELYLDNDCDVILDNCEGYGSPWGFHNTRGIYVLGSPKLINCLGVGGGIGHRLHGILCHDNSEAELINCIGYASPFAYLTPSSFNQHGVNFNGENSVGIKFQRMSASKLTNCIGYGNDMPMGHGIQADMRSFPKLVGCTGYYGGGEKSAGICLTEYATMNVVGGYFGCHNRILEKTFKANNGKGMDYYPYLRPIRHDSNENEVLYVNHWEMAVENRQQAYTIENITFTKSNTNSLVGASLKFYDITDDTGDKSLIASEVLNEVVSGYQYVNLSPYNINQGHHLYICFEKSNVEISVNDGIVGLTIGTSELAENNTGVWINQYWSHERTIDPTNPPYNIVRPALFSQIEAYGNTALVVGENASKKKDFVIANSVLVGDIKDNDTEQYKIYGTLNLNRTLSR